jgi:hypothetical protein
MFTPLEVRTRAVSTAAALMVLGHEPIEIRAMPDGPAMIRFAPSAEADLRRLLAARQRIETLTTAAK